jgi:pimeloyl-ACP methyl ester carboxylesterase
MPTFEQRVDDIAAVMTATGSERAVLLSCSEGGPISVMFAATCPERVSHLILFGTFARFLGTDHYPFMRSKEEVFSLMATIPGDP